jgi:hypothetical protein
MITTNWSAYLVSLASFKNYLNRNILWVSGRIIYTLVWSGIYTTINTLNRLRIIVPYHGARPRLMDKFRGGQIPGLKSNRATGITPRF